MKHLKILLILLLIASSVFAEPVAYRRKNVASRVCGTILDNTTAKAIAAGITGIACNKAIVTDAGNESAFAAISGTPVAIGAVGQFCAPISQSELNIDGDLRIYCTATNTNAASYEITLTTRKADIAVGGIDGLAQTFDGQTLAEGTNTLDLATGQVGVDNQFVGDKIALFSTAGKYYGSSCITASADVNERVTTEDNLAPLHTVGDYYVIKSDAGCQLTATKLQTSAATKQSTNLLTTNIPELSAIPTDGTETLQTLWRAVYQRFFSKIITNTPVNKQQLYKAGGTVKLCESTLTASGGVFTTGSCQ